MGRSTATTLPLRPAAALLSQKSLVHNLSEVVRMAKRPTRLHRSASQVMAVIKADAYGHSVEQILPELERQGIKRFAVASIQEAIEARRFSQKAHLLVLGGTFSWSTKALEVIEREKLEIAVNDLEALQYFSRRLSIPIHLKLDTGMNRLGIKPDDWGRAVSILKESKRKLKGLFTHYATSDDSIFERQVSLFEEAVRWFQSQNLHPEWVHSENSAALFSEMFQRRRGVLSEVANLVRPGLSLYGYLPTHPRNSLQPVLELVSSIELIKRVEVAEGISYGHFYKAKRSHDYGVVPLGYTDGLSKIYGKVLQPRWLSKQGILKGSLSICGSICMDMVMVRSQRGKIEPGDRVIFWGRFPNSLLKEKIIEPYELNLRISKRIPRLWVK